MLTGEREAWARDLGAVMKADPTNSIIAGSPVSRECLNQKSKHSAHERLRGSSYEYQKDHREYCRNC